VSGLIPLIELFYAIQDKAMVSRSGGSSLLCAWRACHCHRPPIIDPVGCGRAKRSRASACRSYCHRDMLYRGEKWQP
jgi:hypothetical protein